MVVLVVNKPLDYKWTCTHLHKYSLYVVCLQHSLVVCLQHSLLSISLGLLQLILIQLERHLHKYSLYVVCLQHSLATPQYFTRIAPVNIDTVQVRTALVFNIQLLSIHSDCSSEYLIITR
jgi:hypothetical protein